ncbi:MAG: hypothetical protein JXB60_04045 [Candidatus Cloacimonetes bacterium]|nr:hypothetical protein [Candidatus Cloacimonadota bacterium]
MTIIEIDKDLFVNVENVFKMEIHQLEGSDTCFIKFYHTDLSYAISKEFDNNELAKDWLTLRIIRAAGTNEILTLNT